MHKFFTLIGILAIVAISSASLVTVISGNVVHEFEVELDGSQAHPPQDVEATGEIEVEFNDDFSTMTVEFEIDGVDIRLAHLHCGPAGEDAPAFFTLWNGPMMDFDGTVLDETFTDAEFKALKSAANCLYVVDLEFLAGEMTHGRVYVNVHGPSDTPLSHSYIRGNFPGGDDDEGGDDDGDDDD